MFIRFVQPQSWQDFHGIEKKRTCVFLGFSASFGTYQINISFIDVHNCNWYFVGVVGGEWKAMESVGWMLFFFATKGWIEFGARIARPSTQGILLPVGEVRHRCGRTTKGVIAEKKRRKRLGNDRLASKQEPNRNDDNVSTLISSKKKKKKKKNHVRNKTAK